MPGCPPPSLMPARALTRSKSKKAPARSKATKVKKSMKMTKKRKLAAKIKIVGRIVHYYDRIGVAIVELARPVRLGDMVHMKRGDLDYIQMVRSLHIEHEPVQSAKKGQVVGLKVDLPVHEGTMVMPG